MAIGRQLSDANSDGIGIGQSATDKVSFYGATPVAQRALAAQALSLNSATSWISVTSNLAAWAAEVTSTLVGLGIWKGAA
jgi:hypothetical protein